MRAYPGPAILCSPVPNLIVHLEWRLGKSLTEPSTGYILGFGDIIAFEYQQTPPLHFCQSLPLYFPPPSRFTASHPARRIPRDAARVPPSAAHRQTRRGRTRSSCDIPPSTRTSFFFLLLAVPCLHPRLRIVPPASRPPSSPSLCDRHTSSSTPARPPATAFSTLMKSSDRLRGRPPGI